MRHPGYIMAIVGLGLSLGAAGFFAGSAVSAQTQTPTPPSSNSSQDAIAKMPNAPGKDITVRVCTKCHSVSNITPLHRDADTWTATVTKMVGYGAVGTDDELQQIVDYLTKYYGPAPDPGTAKPQP